jgi:tetratricopeptide (TPR) repeat protein
LGRGMGGEINDEIKEGEEEKEKLKGNEEFKKNNYKKAIEHYTNGLNIKKNSILYLNRSTCYFLLKEYEKSLLDAKESLIFDDKNLKTYFRIYNCYFELKEFGKVIDFLGFFNNNYNNI